jgi:hypothetical protein
MKELLFFTVLILFTSCAQNALDRNITDNGNKKYLTCGQEAEDVNLYHFILFTDEEMRNLTYAEKLKRRQIPEDFLTKLTTEALFYQFVSCDLSPGMYLYNTAQVGFRRMVEQLNMLPELLNRRDAGSVFLTILQNVDVSNMDGIDCIYFYECLQRIIAQTEVINNMTERDINKYVRLMMHHQDSIKELSEKTVTGAIPKAWAQFYSDSGMF